MTVAGWRLALRLAARDAVANKARTALVLVLIGLPVLVLALVDVGYRTFQVDPEQRVDRAIGTADVGLQWTGTTKGVRQGPGGWTGASTTTPIDRPEPAPTTAAVQRALPEADGSLAVLWTAAADTTVRTPAGLARASFAGLDLGDPLTRGIASVGAGRAPRGSSEVALTRALARSLGLGVGDQVVTVDPRRTYRIVGLVDDGNSRGSERAYVPSDQLAAHSDESNPANLTWLASTDRPVGWEAIRRLNRAGFLVVSRAEYLHPSAAAKASNAAIEAGSTSSRAEYVTPLAIVAGLGLLEVVLLAGPAFSVGAKRRRRDLALVAATGGTARDLRRIVLASGVVSGGLSAVVGVGLGIGLAALGEPLVAPHVNTFPGPFDLRPVDLALVGAVALVAALASSVVPARAAGRTDVVAALAGRRGEVRLRRRTPIVGLVAVVLGVLIASSAFVRTTSSITIVAGVALVEVGLIACTPLLISLVARAGARLRLAPRLALRDAARNRSAATPAVAAVMAAMIGASALVLGVASQNERDYRQYLHYPRLPQNSITVGADSLDRSAVAAVSDAMRHDLPVDGPVFAARGFAYRCADPAKPCRLRTLAVHDDSSGATASQFAAQQALMRPIAGVGPDPLVLAPSEVAAVLGHPDARITAALARGQVVVPDAVGVRNGRLTLDVSDTPTTENGVGDAPPSVTPVQVPALVVSHGFLPARVIVAESLARRYRADLITQTLYARQSRAPTPTELQRFRAVYRSYTPDDYGISVQGPYVNRRATLELVFVLAVAALAVVGAVVATGLANVDGRSDLQTLGAIGAAPRVRRTVSAARAGVIALLGSVLGAVAGTLVPAALVRQSHLVSGAAIDQLRFVVPWAPLLVLVVAVPVIAALIAWTITRSRLPTGALG